MPCEANIYSIRFGPNGENSQCGRRFKVTMKGSVGLVIAEKAIRNADYEVVNGMREDFLV